MYSIIVVCVVEWKGRKRAWDGKWQEANDEEEAEDDEAEY